MRGRPPRSLALPLTAALLLLTAGPALAQETTIPTTPIPEPGMPGQPPISSPQVPTPLGRAVGDAGAALGVLRLLPEAVQTSAILPGLGEELPKQALAEAGLGLSSAQANSEAYLTYERSIAQASPTGLSVAGNAPQTPGSLVQTALPDNPEPTTGGFNAPENPLLNVGLLNGSAHARWSDTLGPCVGTISDATTSLASLSAVNVIPTIPGADQVTGPLREGLENLPGPLSSLGGMLGGGAEPSQTGDGSLLSLPNTLSSRSTVRLVDMPESERKAVESTSTLQAADINILQGTPLQTSIKVASQPTLRVTSTGDKETSKVDYTAPVLTVALPGQDPITIDAANPTADIPIGIPLPGLEQITGFEGVEDVPVLGDVAKIAGEGGGLFKPLTDLAQERVLDIGVLKLSIAALDEKSMDMTDPFTGLQLGASARLLDLQLLPTNALKDALPEQVRDQLPSSLLQLSLGEQVARAYAPAGGVECGTAAPPAPAPPGGGEAPPGVPDELAQTSAAYSSVPMFWTGTAMLLIGAVLVAALPGRRRQTVTLTDPPRPSPRPRD
ncbi:hypothetical protein CFN78_11320 [Amycolatopsis antarctica]|uniref:Uncharacterized protein n=1 Tax=Amycolatopsis antarctica TaxID=1854586 RepID=A0A263D4K2_9PSEU|nr:hypothetical protein [Amycolatopsis antarctica]OZM73412.1 hypothetical protein CFN78_11320 [Amycolatopsis antarctica]